MKIVILTLGSQGDVQPFVALGTGLKKIGHEITICTSYSFKQFITEKGLNYGYMNDDYIKFIGSKKAKKTILSTTNIVAWLQKAIALSSQIKPLMNRALTEQWLAAKDAELILYHPKAMAGYHIAAKLEIPAIMCLPAPIYAATKAFPSIIFPDWKLGGWYNQLTYQLTSLLSLPYRGLVNNWRKKILDLPPTSTIEGQDLPILHFYSSLIVPEPEDWDDRTIAAGYWFLESDPNWQPPHELVKFLDAGSAPVYIGFGSMSDPHPDRLGNLVLEALNISQKRAIIAKGWGGLEIEKTSDRIFVIDRIPHDWLFPQVAAVVHHGGAGTTAAGLRAGKPTVICPFFADQPFWGQRVYDLGVGAKPIPRQKLTAAKLAAAITEVTGDRHLQQRARVLGQQLRAEDGIARAIDLIAKLDIN